MSNNNFIESRSANQKALNDNQSNDINHYSRVTTEEDGQNYKRYEKSSSFLLNAEVNNRLRRPKHLKTFRPEIKLTSNYQKENRTYE